MTRLTLSEKIEKRAQRILDVIDTERYDVVVQRLTEDGIRGVPEFKIKVDITEKADVWHRQREQFYLSWSAELEIPEFNRQRSAHFFGLRFNQPGKKHKAALRGVKIRERDLYWAVKAYGDPQAKTG